jgi:hypothetical protein
MLYSPKVTLFLKVKPVLTCSLGLTSFLGEPVEGYLRVARLPNRADKGLGALTCLLESTLLTSYLLFWPSAIILKLEGFGGLLSLFLNYLLKIPTDS